MDPPVSPLEDRWEGAREEGRVSGWLRTDEAPRGARPRAADVCRTMDPLAPGARARLLIDAPLLEAWGTAAGREVRWPLLPSWPTVTVVPLGRPMPAPVWTAPGPLEAWGREETEPRTEPGIARPAPLLALADGSADMPVPLPVATCGSVLAVCE